VCTATAQQRYPRIASDRNGGAILAWEDHRTTAYDIYAQRVNSGGTPLWGFNGLPVCTEFGFDASPDVFTDTTGTAFLCWADGRTVQGDLYAQKIDPSGVPLWTIDGIQVCNGPAGEGYPVMTPDQQGGFIVAWFDTRPASQYDVYAQRVNGNGTPLWTFSGVPLATTTNTEQGVTICPDSSGGAIVAWYTFPGGATAEDIYAQRLNSLGTTLWATNGVPVCTASQRQEAPFMMADGQGGAFIAWGDDRSVGRDVYMQRVDSGGNRLWQSGGAPVATAPGNQNAWNMVSDEHGGVIISYDDDHSGDPDVFATFVGPTGAIGVFSGAEDWLLLQ
jgi:hypothetical protein